MKMIKINRKSKITFLSVLAILSLSTIMPALAFAAPNDSSAENWEHVNGNTWAWNYSPQTQISSDNVDDLEVKWLFPLEGVTAAPIGIQSANIGQGSSNPVIVADGKAFILTTFLKTYAIDATTGKQLWTHSYDISFEDISSRIPIFINGQLAHEHGFRYWAEGNAILEQGVACDFFGIDADTGIEKFWIKDLCANTPGNQYDVLLRAQPNSLAEVATYEKGRQFIYVNNGYMHSTVWQFGDYRHNTFGIDMDTYEILWRTYEFPPHGVLSKDWALQECDIGYFRDIPCSTVEAQAPENLEWDWAQPNEAPSWAGGVTANWGQAAIDEETGIIYTQTGNQGPYSYIGLTPGPRLYGSTMMAIDMNTGQRVWWNQPQPRDPWDYDCNWSGMLIDDPTLGKVYVKGCKEGVLYVLDAQTGKPINMIDVIPEQYARGQIQVEGTLDNEHGGIRYHNMDPLSNYDMRVMEAPDGSPYCPDPCYIYPSWSNGIFGTDASFDPNTNTIFHYTNALMNLLIESPRPPYEIGSTFMITSGTGMKTNSTIVARDLVTGQEKWTWYGGDGLQRAAMITTNGLLIAGRTDGNMNFFDSNTGEILNTLIIGGPLTVGLTTGEDSNGDQKIFALVGTRSSNTPGTLVAIGLDAKAQSDVVTRTVTSTSRTTLTSTSVSTTTAQGQTQTQTVTSSVTEETIGTITYAAVAVAVIAIIGAALIYTKKITI